MVKLSSAQLNFIDDVLKFENKINKKIWLICSENRLAMGTPGEDSKYFYVNEKTVYALTKKGVLIEESYINDLGEKTTGFTVKEEYR